MRPDIKDSDPRGRILVVDDDPDVLTAARFALKCAFDVVETDVSPTRLQSMATNQAFDAVLLDMNFMSSARSGREGLDWLARLRQADPTLSVVLMTAYGAVDLAVECLKKGGTDFVLKPWQNEKLVATMSAAVALSHAKRDALQLKLRADTLAADSMVSAGELVGSAPPLRRVLELIRRAAPTDANILILGESGTGKELSARAIHRSSRRSQAAFVCVDLGAIAESLFESELFGHKRGAFTGADRDRAGRVQAADGGTLFLDEIANLPIHLQRKLLTVLERREVTPVGATQAFPVDIRLITATNRPLSELAREEVFRQDLFFRVKTVEIVMPPLRERREDIPALLEHFLLIYARKNNVPRRRLAPETLQLLEDYSWPGNIRELRHAVERATILARGERLEPEDFPFARTSTPAAAAGPFDLEQVERLTIARALTRFEGNISLAAAALGLTRPSLYRRIAKYGL
jgi:DNA-binding NtrC family response regulator